jgi:hypothetical protein
MRELKEREFGIEAVEGILGPLAWTTLFRTLGLREVLRRVPILGRCLCPLLVGLMNLRMALEDAITPASISQTNACIYLVVARKTR